MVYYLPSCNVVPKHPQASKKIIAYLKNRGVKILGCCRVSQNLFNDGDTVIYSCMNCGMVTEELSPQVHLMSIFEYVLTDESFPWPDLGGERITLQDCWKSRTRRSNQLAVRECMRRMNLVPIELEKNFEKAETCGIWLSEPVSEKNLNTAPRLFREVSEKWTHVLPEKEKLEKIQREIAAYPTEKALVYCITCEDGIRFGGGHPVHLLDLMTDRI